MDSQLTTFGQFNGIEFSDFVAGFMKELDSVRRLAEDSNESSLPSPVLVQCASGSGRTGVLILAELMVQCLERNHVSD